MKMNKKGMALKTIVEISLISMVGFIILITVVGPEGLWGGAAHAAMGFTDDILAKLPGKTFTKPITQTPQDMQDAATSLWTVLKADQKDACLVNYPKFPKNFNDYIIRLTQLKDKITIVLISPEGQIIDMGLDIPEKELCIVAGDSAERFYNQFQALKKGGKFNINAGKLYKAVPSIDITGDKIIFENQKCDFKDVGVLFHNDEKHSCFLSKDNSLGKRYDGCGVDNVYVLDDINTLRTGLGMCLPPGLDQATKDKCAQMPDCREINSQITCRQSKSKECEKVCYWIREHSYNPETDMHEWHNVCKNCNELDNSGCAGYNRANKKDAKKTCLENPCGFEPTCYWADDSDRCQSCGQISECKDYDENSCEINPCKIPDGCGWATPSFKLDYCQSCDQISICKDYDEQGCKTNPCNIKDGCEWVAPWLGLNYCKSKGET